VGLLLREGQGREGQRRGRGGEEEGRGMRGERGEDYCLGRLSA